MALLDTTFVLAVHPIQPVPDETEAWEIFIEAVNAGGWGEVPSGLADARSSSAGWESLLDSIGGVDGIIENEKGGLTEAIGRARAEYLVSQLVRRVLLARAECLERLERWEECLECYSKVESDGEDPALYFKRGCCYYYTGNTGAAESNFELALLKDPSLQSQIDQVKDTQPPTGGGTVPQNPGEIGPRMIGPMRPGEARPVYDVAFEASALQEDPQLEQALQASLKEDHFSAAGSANSTPPSSTTTFDLPANVKELEASLTDCLSEASQLPQCALQPWSAMVPEESEALELLGWTEQTWETAACTAPWEALSEVERTAAERLGFNAASWVWMKFREWLPNLVAHVILRKGQPTWEETMIKRNAEGVAAAEEYETVHRRLIDLSTRVLVEALGRRYKWATNSLLQLLDKKQEGLYTCKKWSQATGKYEEHGAPQLCTGAVSAFMEAHGVARIAEALERTMQPDDGSLPILQLVVRVHASIDEAEALDDLVKDTTRVVTACVDNLTAHVSEDHGGTILLLQQLLKLKVGRTAGVQLWKDLCVRGLRSEKYLARVSALEQLVNLADSTDAGLTAEEFTDWVETSKVYDQVFGEKMPLDKPEYKQRAKVFFRHAKLVHSEATFVHWTNLLLPKLSASVIQDLIVEICLDNTIPVELWIQLVKRLVAIIEGQPTEFDGDEQCQQSVLAFVPVLFTNIEPVTKRHAAVSDCAELLRAALDAFAALPDRTQEADCTRLLLVNAYTDMWNFVDDSDQFLESSTASAEPLEAEEGLTAEDLEAKLAELEQKQRDGKFVAPTTLNRLRKQVNQAARGQTGQKRVAFAGETFDAEDATKERGTGIVDLSHYSQDQNGQHKNDKSESVVPGLNLSAVNDSKHSDALSLSEEQVLEECMQVLEGNENGASRGQVIRLIQEIRQQGGVVSTDLVVTKMFDTPMEPEDTMSTASIDSIRAERLRQEREAAAQSEPAEFREDLSDTAAFPELSTTTFDTEEPQTSEDSDDHAKWSVYVCSGPNGEDWLSEARKAQQVATETRAATDTTQTCTQASRALKSIIERLASLEEKIGAERASDVVHAVRLELFNMRAHAFFGIGHWKRCIEDCEDYLDLAPCAEIEELNRAAARRKFDEGDNEDESSSTLDDVRTKRKRSAQNFTKDMQEDPNIVEQLMQMGFSLNSCKKASRAARDLESAAAWLVQHSQDDDIDDDPGDPGDAVKENEVRTDSASHASAADGDAGIIRSDGTTLNCAVTYNDTTDWVGMAACKHKFSTLAWQDWIRTHRAEPSRLVCMGQSCNVPIPTQFVLEMVEPGDREMVKKAIADRGSTSTSGGSSAATVAAPLRSFHESLRDLRMRHARLCVADINQQMQDEAGCMGTCRPVALDFLVATLQSFSTTQVDIERRANFIEELNAKNEWGTTLVEMLLKETVGFATSCCGDAQRQGVSSRLELITLLHRFCKPLLLSWEMTSRLWDGLEALECRLVLFSWIRASLTHTSDTEPVYEGAYACFTSDVREQVLSRLVEMSASRLDVQAYHLFQNVMIGINADAGKLKIGSWCQTATNISGGDYCASSAIPAGNGGVDFVEFDVAGSNSVVGVSASPGSITKELHGSRAVPKGQDGAKLVGTWVKVLQHGQVWKDGQLTRCHSKPGSSLYDIRYVDGCVQRRNLQSLKSWMIIDPLEAQMPMVINITAVTDGDLVGLDVLWRAAVQSPNEKVSVLARSLLFRLYTQMGDTLCSEETIQLALDTADPMLAETIRDSMGVSHTLACKALVLNKNEWESTFQWLQDKQMNGSLDMEAVTPLTLEQAQLATDALPADLRARLIDQVEDGVHQSIAMIDAGHKESAEQTVRRQIDIVQSFVNRYHSNGKTRQHSVSRRGSQLTVKVLDGTVDAHVNMTCSELHSVVCAQLQLAASTLLEVVKSDKTTVPLSCSASTLRDAGVQNDFEIRELRDKTIERPAAENSAVADHFCPGELLARSDTWFELLFGLLGREISTTTRSAIWQLLMSIPTMACEKNEVLQFRISWSKAGFLRTVYDLQIVEAIIDPPSDNDESIADEWRRLFVSNGDHFTKFVEFVTKMESHGVDLDDPMVCAQCLPVTLRVLYFCVRCALPDITDKTHGLSRSFSSSSATAVFGTLENAFGRDYFSVLVDRVCFLMDKAVGSKQSQATIFGAKVLLAVAGQPDATRSVLRVGVPLLITLLVTCPEDVVRAEAVDVLRSIALVSEEAGLSIMHQVRMKPPTDEYAGLCDEYFALLRELQRSLCATRQDLAASLVTDLHQMCTADVEHQKNHEKPTTGRIDLLRDICERDATVRDIVVAKELIELLWSRYLMAIASDDADQEPVCRSAVGRQAVCALLNHVVSKPVDSAVESSHLDTLVQLVCDFVSSTQAPMQRDGESPEFDYDPEQRTGYGDSTTTKLRNSTNLAGLTNQGNTCYMNSVLQQLYGSREARRAVLDAPLGLRVRVENYSESMKSGAEVTLYTDEMKPLSLTGDHALAFNGTSELTSTLPEGRYVVRVCCDGKVISQEHEFGTGVHSIVLSDHGGQVEQQIRSQQIVTEVHRCFWFLEYGAAACVDTSSLCNSLHACRSPSGASYLEYPIRSQNDAAEFLGKIVDTLGEDMMGSRAASNLKDLLTSTKVVEKQCLECKTVSHSAEDHAVLLSVTIETPELEKLGSLEQALESAAKPEILSGTNAVDCDKCGKKCPTSRSSLVTKLPRVLLVHLTRFVQNMYGEYHKANHRVTFPQRLDMRPYTTTSADRDVSELPAWYELTGVVLHSGTQRAGHYTSLVKHEGQWITFDDQHASPFEGDLEDVCFGGEEEIIQSWGTNRTSKREKSKNAYILMYQREEDQDLSNSGGSSSSSGGGGGGGGGDDDDRGGGGGGGDNDSSLGAQMQASPGTDSAAEGETPDPATWAARRNLCEALQQQKQTLQRQQRLLNPEVLGLIRSLCVLGLGNPDQPEPGSNADVAGTEPEPEPEPRLDADTDVKPEPEPEPEPETGLDADADVEPEPELGLDADANVEPEPEPEPEPQLGLDVEPEPGLDAGQESEPVNEVQEVSVSHMETGVDSESDSTELDSRLLHLGVVTFVHIVCRYKDHADITAWSTLLAYWLSQPKHLGMARWLVLRVGSEDGWEEANALIVPVVPKSYTARTAFCTVLRAAVDAVRRQLGEQEDSVEAATVVPLSSDQAGDDSLQSSDTVVADLAPTVVASSSNSAHRDGPSESHSNSDAQAEPVLAASKDEDAHGEDKLSADDLALNNALASVRKHLSKYEASINASTSTAGGAGRRNAIGPDTCPPVPPLLLMDRAADVDPLDAVSVKIENNDSKPMRLSGQPSPDRDWISLQTIAPGSQFTFEKNQMSTFKGLVEGVGEYTWKRKVADEGPLTFNKRNYTGFSQDYKEAAGGQAAHSKPNAATVASKDAASGPESVPGTAGGSHKADPTPEEEAIISQAIEMLCCDRQAVLTVIENLKIADKIIGPEIVIDTLLSSH